MREWFDVVQSTPYLYTIRERLDLIEPRFLTSYTNLYLILGRSAAILFDTGTGLGDLRAIIDPLVKNRELIVINSHNHFDHIGGNHLFEETSIHRMDFKKLMKPMDLSFLSEAQEPYLSEFKSKNFSMTFAPLTIPLIGNEIFDLGGINAKVIYTPGHTPGSICLQLDTGEIFTGDTLHYGAIFLPDLSQMDYYRESLNDLLRLFVSSTDYQFYPGHENFGVGIELIEDFYDAFVNLEWSNARYDEFLMAEVVTKNTFHFVRPTQAI